MRLRRLTKFSRIELEAERDDLRAKIAELEEVLGSDELLRDMVKSDLQEVSARLSTPRRTLLLASAGEGDTVLAASAPQSGSSSAPALEIPDEPCVVVLTATGGLARVEGGDVLERGARASFDGWKMQIPTTTR